MLLMSSRLASAAARSVASWSFAAASARRLLPPVLVSGGGCRRPLVSGTAAALGRVNTHDAKLSSLLDSELRYENSAAAEHQHQQQRQRLPQPPQGFAVTARDGTQFTLTRKCPDDGSLLEVTFDLNGSTASQHDHGEDQDGEEDAEAAAGKSGVADPAESAADEAADEEIQSRPDLTFRVRKPASPQACLAVRCSFPPVHVSRQMAADDPDYPSLSIDTVAVEGVGAELGAYELEADMLNDDLYKQLAEMLVHRGVTREFENSLVEFCTAQEHQLYLRFLAEAKKFCDA